MATGAVEWFDEVYRIYGCDRETFDPQLHDALGFYDAEGRRLVQGHIAEALANRTGYAYELNLRRGDGRLRRVVCRAGCELDETGRAVALVGVLQDVTEQARLLEQATRERERYRLLAENATDVIATYRPDATFTYVSPRANASSATGRRISSGDAPTS